MKYKRYLSYPPANYTLDYILIPKKFKFKSFDCLGENLSDHKALVAEIKI
jgi:endonuclease/exonuclease/phosphatase family metal-dependent hydrolase